MCVDDTTVSGGGGTLAHDRLPTSNLIFWKNVLLAHVHSGQPNLTNRQMTILMVIYASDHPHTVGWLASHLSLSGPVVSRALNALQALGLIGRMPDPFDRRSSILKRTAAGTAFLDRLRNTIVESRHV